MITNLRMDLRFKLNSACRHAAHVATWPAAGTARPRVAAMYTSSSCSTRRDACPGHGSSHLRTLPLHPTRGGAACPAAVLPAAVRLAHQLHGVAHRVALDNGQYSHRIRFLIYLFRSAAVDNLETAEAAGLSQEDEQHWPQYDRHCWSCLILSSVFMERPI